MTDPGASVPLGFDPAVMDAVVTDLARSVDALGGHADSMPETPGAGVSSAAVAGILYAIADSMIHLTAELQLVGTNITRRGAVYADQDAVNRGGLDVGPGD